MSVVDIKRTEPHGREFALRPTDSFVQLQLLRKNSENQCRFLDATPTFSASPPLKIRRRRRRRRTEQCSSPASKPPLRFLPPKTNLSYRLAGGPAAVLGPSSGASLEDGWCFLPLLISAALHFVFLPDWKDIAVFFIPNLGGIQIRFFFEDL